MNRIKFGNDTITLFIEDEVLKYSRSSRNYGGDFIRYNNETYYLV